MFLLVSLAVVTIVALATFAAGRRSGRLAPVVLAALGIVGGLWVMGIAVILGGWRDIDGWVDCFGHCHGWHWLGALWFFTPPLFAAELLLIAVGDGLRRRLRSQA